MSNKRTAILPDGTLRTSCWACQYLDGSVPGPGSETSRTCSEVIIDGKPGIPPMDEVWEKCPHITTNNEKLRFDHKFHKCKICGYMFQAHIFSNIANETSTCPLCSKKESEKAEDDVRLAFVNGATIKCCGACPAFDMSLGCSEVREPNRFPPSSGEVWHKCPHLKEPTETASVKVEDVLTGHTHMKQIKLHHRPCHECIHNLVCRLTEKLPIGFDLRLMAKMCKFYETREMIKLKIMPESWTPE